MNSWNDVWDNNHGKTASFTTARSYAKFSWSTAWYTGPETAATSTGRRNLYGTVLSVNPAQSVKVYVNFDYGQDRQVGTGAARWAGIAGAERWAVSRRFSVSSRAEWFRDAEGYMTPKAAVVRQRWSQVSDPSGFSTAAQFTQWVTTAIAASTCG